MLKLATLSLAALLSLASPVFALGAGKAPGPAAALACTSPETIVAKLPEPVLIKLDGDKLAAFKAAYPQIPGAIDLMIVFGAKNAKAFIGVSFVKGCSVGYGVLPPSAALPLVGVAVDDGSI